MAERTSKILRKPAENVDVEDWHNLMLVDFNGLQDKKDPSVIPNGRLIDGVFMPSRPCLKRDAKSVVFAWGLDQQGGPKIDRLQDGPKIDKFSLAPVARIVEEKLGGPVTFCSACVRDEVGKACADSAAASVIWLESSGFPLGEDAVENKAAFRPSFRKLVNVYCTMPSARPTARAAPQ